MIRRWERRDQDGFSLLELLCVAAIALVTIGLLAPAVGSILAASNLSSATNQIQDELMMARSLAMAHSKVAEARFFQDPNGTGYSGLRVYLEDSAGGFQPVRRLVRLPSGVVVSLASDASPLLRTTPDSSGTEPGFSGYPGAVAYDAVRFGAGGATTRPRTTTESFLTISPAHSAPSNFAILQILPATGTTHVYRP